MLFYFINGSRFIQCLRFWIALALTAAIIFSSTTIPIQAAAQTTDLSAEKPIVNPLQVYSYSRLSVDLQALTARYPHLLTLGSAGKSEYGRTLFMVDVGRGPAVIMLNGAHHAREWMTTITLMKLVEQLAVQYEKNGTVLGGFRARDLLDRVTFRIVPMVNPDGVTLQQFGLSAFPAADHANLRYMNNGSGNFKRWKANAKGIDLNRQYPANWNGIVNAANRPAYMNYKGALPLQAKEAKAMYDLALTTKPEISLAYHTSGEVIYWNFHTTPANYSRDYSIASAYAKLTGYSLVAPQSNPSGGGFTDWFIQQFGRPALTPELGRAAGSTNVPLSEWNQIWQQHKDTLWMIAEKGYGLWLKRQSAATLTQDIRLFSVEKGFQFPDLRAKSMGTVYQGSYKSLRKKGDWLEIATPDGPRWISSRAVIAGPFETPVNLAVNLTEPVVHYDTPISTEPSSLVLTAQTAIVRERWNGWLLVEALEGMIWVRETDLPTDALTVLQEETMEETKIPPDDTRTSVEIDSESGIVPANSAVEPD
ncbi:M14 family metallopeptidase [Cohnella hashimotonis]|uniref:M14 family metallocarboxypeptidase n=1 Tax=Cohnella hashimotonis TaxID=2826895 RepID=A0ABT6TG95_9BACL|nr:M14 family metallocarboxypeptidase [Cohnella hashimotonis]MDI4645861.1 M14 family metallocarboxypeptidase [Cohnella hashimotonis]